MMDFKKNIKGKRRLIRNRNRIYKSILNYIRKSILAAVGGLFVLLYGCGYGGAGETIVIGNAEVRGAAGEDGSAYAQGEEGQEAKGETPAGERKADTGELPDDEGEKAETLIRVYVCGAVENPCVVTLPLGSRAEDALLAAGGFAEGAAMEAVNLADWVADGQMLYIPSEEEAEEMNDRNGQNSGMDWNQGISGTGTYSASGRESDSGLVNINTADLETLTTLPGIGESRAADIIAYREKNGAFESCEDIMKVSGIKTSVYEKISDKITVK